MVDRVPRCGPAGGSPVRDAGHVCRTHAFTVGLGRGQHGLVSKICACARAQSPRAVAHGLHAHTACAIGGGWLELWTPPQERRGLCQAPDTRMWLNARNVERDETSSVFARKHPIGKVECLAFQRAIPNLVLSESNHGTTTEAVRQDPPLDR